MRPRRPPQRARRRARVASHPQPGRRALECLDLIDGEPTVGRGVDRTVEALLADQLRPPWPDRRSGGTAPERSNRRPAARPSTTATATASGRCRGRRPRSGAPGHRSPRARPPRPRPSPRAGPLDRGGDRRVGSHGGVLGERHRVRGPGAVDERRRQQHDGAHRPDLGQRRQQGPGAEQIDVGPAGAVEVEAPTGAQVDAGGSRPASTTPGGDRRARTAPPPARRRHRPGDDRPGDRPRPGPRPRPARPPALAGRASPRAGRRARPPRSPRRSLPWGDHCPSGAGREDEAAPRVGLA